MNCLGMMKLETHDWYTLMQLYLALAVCSRKELAVWDSSGNGKLPGLTNLQSCNPAITEVSIVVTLDYI